MKCKDIIVMGAGRFGASFAQEADAMGHRVLLMDKDPDLIDDWADHVTHGVVGDVRQEEDLLGLGISNFDIAVIAITSDYEASIMATVLCSEMKVPMIVAKARDERHASILKRIGAHRVVFPEQDSGIRLAHSITHKNIMDFIALSEDYDLLEITPLDKWVGKTLAQNDINRRYGVNVIAARKDGQVTINPSRDYVVTKATILTVLGQKEEIHKLEKSGL